MSHSLEEVSPLEDDEVDRAEVEVQQCTELTVTNRSKHLTTNRSTRGGTVFQKAANEFVGLKKKRTGHRSTAEALIMK